MSAHHPITTATNRSFSGLLECVLWNVQIMSMSFDKAEAACSAHVGSVMLGTGSAIVCLLAASFINNAIVLCSVVRTRSINKLVYFFTANLAMSDLLAGMELLLYTIAMVEQSSSHEIMYSLTFLMFSQAMSVSGLCLMSINSYVALKYPILFYTQASDIQSYAGVAIVSSWLVLSLLFALPSMGLNCLDTPTESCFGLFHIAFIYGLVAMYVFLAMIILLTNIITFRAIRKRQGRGNEQKQWAREYEKNVHRAQTVMIHAVVAFIAVVVPRIAVVSTCHLDLKTCLMVTGPGGLVVLFVLNSAVNPIASIIRTPDLREGTWLGCMISRKWAKHD
uniref:G-protein coupled receptors family 1 profile domain-containing protein n=1 Tax=Branchiostoma floridae TaxID=7739 RepID=C3ZM98_BRAFL|eukprot:XP_002590343.1 hypothetical protein BRAFLDRAFT_76603 [Branchiostoma floridae]